MLLVNIGMMRLMATEGFDQLIRRRVLHQVVLAVELETVNEILSEGLADESEHEPQEMGHHMVDSHFLFGKLVDKEVQQDRQ